MAGRREGGNGRGNDIIVSKNKNIKKTNKKRGWEITQSINVCHESERTS